MGLSDRLGLHARLHGVHIEKRVQGRDPVGTRRSKRRDMPIPIFFRQSWKRDDDAKLGRVRTKGEKPVMLEIFYI